MVFVLEAIFIVRLTQDFPLMVFLNDDMCDIMSISLFREVVVHLKMVFVCNVNNVY